MTCQFEKNGQLKPLTDAELLEADKGMPVIVRDQGITSDGIPYWLYLAVKPSKYREFYRLTKDHIPVRFADFGTILRYGYSETIPERVKQEMKEEYGCEDDYMEKITEEVRNAQSAFLREQEAIRLNDIVDMLKRKNL